MKPATLMFQREAVHQLLLEMAKQRSAEKLFAIVVRRLAGLGQIALARIWTLRPGDTCSTCPVQAECTHHESCLHLVASAGRSIQDAQLQWNNIDGQYSRFPLGARKVGHIAASGQPIVVEAIDRGSTWIADMEWARRENILGFAGQPLMFQGEVLGVLAVFTRLPLNADVLDVLRLIADHAAAALANTLVFAEIQELKTKLEYENSCLREELFDVAASGGFIGQSRALQQVINQIDLVAPTNASVLILGESGTGKELVAREIHHRSLRKDRPLIKVNCASISRDLFESEFFGHAKGAFTGALRDRMGRFEAADGGTLFLDELGEIPLEQQSKLLRVLQEGEYERVGEQRVRTTDARIIAATNKNLEEEVLAKRFREDLYFRLGVFPIKVPPLRQRPEDIILLANYFLEKALQEMNRPPLRFSQPQLDQLVAYSWPGNVRELRNIIEQVAIYAHSGALYLNLPRSAVTVQRGAEGEARLATSEKQQGEVANILREQEIAALMRSNTLAALNQCGWKIYGSDGAAALLGLKPTTLAARIKKMGLQRPISYDDSSFAANRSC
nr:sigma 54-interacting transcriptional regulator [uncultured Desulfobulbus sp.]